MRICIIALGSRGDVQPLVTLGHGARVAGHEVCVAAEPEFEPLVQRYGLEYSRIHGNVRQYMQTGSIQSMIQGKRLAPIAQISWASFNRRFSAGTQQRMIDVWQAAQKADAVVVATFGLIAAYSAAEKLRRPLIRVFYSPPDLPITRGFRSRPRWDQLTQRIFLQSTWSIWRSPMNRARREVLGLAPLPVFTPTADLDQKPWPALCAFSAHVSPPSIEQKRPYHHTGYWFLPDDRAWQPPRELSDFLAAGPPPIYFGFGSMTNKAPAETTEIIVKALARAGQRGVLATGWGGLKRPADSDRVYVVDDVPHDWLFTQVAAAVHHGGAGTTASVLRAGRPSVVVPFGIPEQPFWGERIAHLGAGLPPINRRHLSVDGLAQAIRTLVDDTSMQRRAAALGERIRAENGVARAVEVLESSVRNFDWAPAA